MSRRRRRSPKQTFGWLTISLIVVVGFIAYYYTRLQLPPYLVWIITLSAITFFWYGFDKGQSKRGRLRVPEVILNLLTLAGGFPGAWLGLLVFHHKTRQRSFLVVLILSTVLHLGLASALLTS